MLGLLQKIAGIFIAAGIVFSGFGTGQTSAQDLEPTLFFDGSSDPRLQNAYFGGSAVDSQGRLLIVSYHPCGGWGCLRVNAILPDGSLEWQTIDLRWDTFAPGTLLLGPDDRVYIHPNSNVIHAFDSSGERVTGWPVTVTGAEGGTVFKAGPIVDSRDGTVFVKVGINFSWERFPASVVALYPDGREKWRRDYPDDPASGHGMIQGPARDIYTLIATRDFVTSLLVALDHGNGNQVCQTPTTAYYGSLVAGLEGVFTSFRADVKVYDASCRSGVIFSSSGPETELRGFDQGRIFAIERERLFAVSKEGTLLWRNQRVSVFSNPNPIRAIKNNMLYVIGRDTADGNRQKLFLVHAASGQILYVIPTAPQCEACGVAVADDGTIYLNDLQSTRIYSITGAVTERQTVFLVHGIAQRGGYEDNPRGDTLTGLARSLQDPTYGIDQKRFIIDAGFDFRECAVDCVDNCSIRRGGDKLAQYISRSNPVGDIIIIGYSMGGLIARDMMLNHPELFEERGVAALITLGTPHLGYPWSVGDWLARCDPLARQMYGDFRNRATDSWTDLCLKDDGSMGSCDGGGEWIAAVSQYLFDLNRLWTSRSFAGQPAFWYTMAGTSCDRDIRRFSDRGCANGTRNDNVICRESASFDRDANNGPTQRWEDAEHNYAHTDGRFLLFCQDAAHYPLWNPASDPNHRLAVRLRDWINALP